MLDRSLSCFRVATERIHFKGMQKVIGMTADRSRGDVEGGRGDQCSRLLQSLFTTSARLDDVRVPNGRSGPLSRVFSVEQPADCCSSVRLSPDPGFAALTSRKAPLDAELNERAGMPGQFCKNASTRTEPYPYRQVAEGVVLGLSKAEGLATAAKAPRFCAAEDVRQPKRDVRTEGRWPSVTPGTVLVLARQVLKSGDNASSVRADENLTQKGWFACHVHPRHRPHSPARRLSNLDSGASSVRAGENLTQEGWPASSPAPSSFCCAGD
ncbi:hypothetical protein OF83DRAFT_1085384 [Amylostereum chailletii]|nr:hypothetical protein OF83DRAFT_1085384 [Amylostereum chailletii]